MIGILDYVWLVPLAPVLCFVIAGFFGKKTPQGGGYIAIAGALIAFIIAALASYDYFTSDYYANNIAYTVEMEWMAVGEFSINFGVYIDTLSCIMMLFASFISTLIFIYSIGYMDDQGVKKTRYYAEVSLFLTGMLGLAVSSNYLEMFVFWEVMGLCSYLLIGFWSFTHPEGDEAAFRASSAAKKAFLVTRLGDVCLMAGLFVLLHLFGSLDYADIFNFDIATVDSNMLMVAILLMFAGVVGKSAQFPLHDWLPDAMAGPTTVSALIHAATMVKAGIYLVARSYPIFIHCTDAMIIVAVIGGVTAIYTASMALNNMNIKRVLAYSTLSQLGYMVLALGAGAYLMSLGIEEGEPELMLLGGAGYAAGIFHMINHAFFKALLFLCSGSVIHAVGTEDMRMMGGLRTKMPITAYTMLIGSLSIAGIPILSGFWSKDLVLEAAFAPFHHGLGAGSIFMVLFILGMITAFMTAFYMFRMWFMTFCGEPRGHCHGESPKPMTVPLCILAVFAVISGLFVVFDGSYYILESLRTTIDTVIPFHTGMEIVEEIFTAIPTYVALVLAVVGIGIAWKLYVKTPYDAEAFKPENHGALYNFNAKRHYFPELYNWISWKFGAGVAKGVNALDVHVIDGTVNGLSNAVVGGGEGLSAVQTGYVRDYAGLVAVGVISILAVFCLIFLYGGGF
ncbi:MAG: proton-conducting transporter membrane subunit [Candidatus Methanomethylophilaceae archaeon]|nr:proton-conducting transporter membrane subunit [Candidatus Methanomethylophilaceae archaeon]MDY5872627.1 proton-conducting transporter membrane subunit [Candidatus Methanomethylophilaceae archaeon]